MLPLQTATPSDRYTVLRTPSVMLATGETLAPPQAVSPYAAAVAAPAHCKTALST